MKIFVLSQQQFHKIRTNNRKFHVITKQKYKYGSDHEEEIVISYKWKKTGIFKFN